MLGLSSQGAGTATLGSTSISMSKAPGPGPSPFASLTSVSDVEGGPDTHTGNTGDKSMPMNPGRKVRRSVSVVIESEL